MYTAIRFKEDIKRIFLSANIGHIKNISGNWAFGPSRFNMYYLVQKISEDRYKILYFRTLPEMLKEFMSDFNKYHKMFPTLSIIVDPEMIRSKKFDKSTEDSIKHYIKRQYQRTLSYREMKMLEESASLWFKKSEMLNKRKLFDLLVAKGKLDMSLFEKYYGSMGDDGENVSDRIKHYKHEDWDIYLDVKTKRGIDEVIQLLDSASKDLKKRGYSKLCYGKVFLVDNLGGKTLADYSEKNDTMRIGFKMLKKSNAEFQRIAFIHEIGHRNYFKFLNSNQRGEISSKYLFFVKIGGTTRTLKKGEDIVGKSSGDIFKIEDREFKRSFKYIVSLIELGEKTKFKTKDLNQRFMIDEKFVGVEYIPENVGEGDENTYVPRAYGLTDKEEFYAVLWETWFQDKLKDPAKTWFESLEK